MIVALAHNGGEDGGGKGCKHGSNKDNSSNSDNTNGGGSSSGS